MTCAPSPLPTIPHPPPPFSSPSRTSPLSPSQVVRQLGGRVVTSPHRCSHFVAERFVRTVNLLVAVARGCHVATPDWLFTSREARSFVDASCFPLRDRVKEGEMEFDLQRAVREARRQPLLQVGGVSTLLERACL